VVERHGRHSEARIQARDAGTVLQPVDLMEWNALGDPLPTPAALTLKPFEIRTFKLQRS
jgi:hypothetical protein